MFIEPRQDNSRFAQDDFYKNLYNAAPVFTELGTNAYSFQPYEGMYGPDKMNIPDGIIYFDQNAITQMPQHFAPIFEHGYVHAMNPQSRSFCRHLAEKHGAEQRTAVGIIGNILRTGQVDRLSIEPGTSSTGEGVLRVTTKYPFIHRIQQMPKCIGVAILERQLLDYCFDGKKEYIYRKTKKMDSAERLLFFAVLGIHPDDLFTQESDDQTDITYFRDTGALEALSEGNQFSQEALYNIYAALYNNFWEVTRVHFDNAFVGKDKIHSSLEILRRNGILEKDLQKAKLETFGRPIVVLLKELKEKKKKKEKGKKVDTPHGTNVLKLFSNVPLTAFMENTYLLKPLRDGEAFDEAVPTAVYKEKVIDCSNKCSNCEIFAYCKGSLKKQ